MHSKKVANLVADAGAFILNCPLQNYGESIYTLPEVINEIKDDKTRDFLKTLPYQLNFREPTDDDIKYVAYFAKKTGDFVQLSTTDIRLMALTVHLEKELNQGVHLNASPEIKILPSESSGINPDKITLKELQHFGYNLDNLSGKLVDDKIENEIDDQVVDCDDGWITCDNIEEIKRKMSDMKFDEEDGEKNENLSLACITGDFAMQNVLMQMGLRVLSPKDGLLIRQTRQFVLRCHACGRINPPNADQFCKSCGNFRTLKKVAFTINQDGSVKIHINYKKPIRIRGTKYSIPLPRGGKHSNDPILCEDQKKPQQRITKSAIKEKNALNMQFILEDPDYLARTNPFAINDVYSRASRMISRQRKNGSGHRNKRK
ncbi:RNA-binding protein NOB1 [Sarcoptes scabiei]|uniref:RNA-binding protein NOB1 n=1 Tax=Sarcoptes scabiei TaxID=52283 RepID=A0A131ZX20_SARSC|nr:RNA-binding protein NOB1 [Sarcoptes scabiei]KPM02660.1 RNA-binding protein NOB1-like protein [Sarcoptes scabiei]